MALVIRKRLSLEFLGDEYKDAFLIFKSIPVKDFETMQTDIQAISEDNKKALAYIIAILKKYFISGEAPNEKGEMAEVTSDDINELDQSSVIKCFETLTGQSINEDNDFLDKGLTKPSQTAQPSQSS